MNENETMKHLGNVLYMLNNLHDDYRCRAFEDALKYYNERNQNAQVAPDDGYEQHLIFIGPLDRALGHTTIKAKVAAT